jgi:site-specific DNA-methyltransferase (adenine-specific)
MSSLWVPTLINADSLEYLKEVKTNSIDSIVSDPPYGLGQMSKSEFTDGGFMGKSWDAILPPTPIWKECFRVLKPGGFIVAMSASRTYHRLGVQLEQLGFITHPMIGWIYGSGFPKATDLSKQFDKQAGAEREVVGKRKDGATLVKGSKDTFNSSRGPRESGTKEMEITTPSTDKAKQWNGWKYGLQALKPSLEPIYVGQKPHLKPMTRNIDKYGVGAMNIDGCRVEFNGDKPKESELVNFKGDNYNPNNGDKKPREALEGRSYIPNNQGRHPSNLLHDGSEVVEREFLEQGGVRKSGELKEGHKQNQNNHIIQKAKETNTQRLWWRLRFSLPILQQTL